MFEWSETTCKNTYMHSLKIIIMTSLWPLLTQRALMTINTPVVTYAAFMYRL